MKVVKFKVKNLFGIKEFEADGKSIELIGQNATGKTSVIDAFKLALTNKSDRDYIIKKGETEGEVILETDVGLRIHRKIREGKADYKSIKDPSNSGENTESFLRKIFNNLQLNPIEFLSMSKDEQNRIVLDLIEFDWDLNWIKNEFGEIVPDVNYEQNILCVLNEIQSENGYYFMKRQNINRDVREKKAIVEDIGSSLPLDYNASKWEKADVGELYKTIARTQKENSTIEKAKQLFENYDNKVRGFKADYQIEVDAILRATTEERTRLGAWIKECENTIKEAKKDMDNLEQKRVSETSLAEKSHKANIAEFEGEIKEYKEVAKQKIQPIDDLQKEADEIQSMKAHINEYKRMVGYVSSIEELNKESEFLTAKIEHARELPGEILEKCKIPVAGLTVVAGLPLINGLPISNLSEGEKLNLCVDIASQKGGSLEILLIDGVERLSKLNRIKLYMSLKAKGCQFIATRTDDTPDLTVIQV